MILILSPEENEVLTTVAALGLSAQTTISYMLDVCGSLQLVVQDSHTEERDTESMDEVISVPSQDDENEDVEEAEA